MSQLQLVLRPGGRRLIDIVTKLPNLGVGAKVTRDSWLPYGDYFEITDVKLRKADGSAGRVWGVLHWRGRRADAPARIPGAAKRAWRWLPPAGEEARLRALAAQVQSAQDRAKAAAAAAAAGGSGGSSGGSGGGGQ